MNLLSHFSGFNSKLDNIGFIQIVKITGCVSVCCVSCKFIYTFFLDIQEKHALDKIRQKKQFEREQHFLQIKSRFAKDINSKKEQEWENIVSLNLKQLQEKLFKRDLLAEHVLQAYIWKSLKVQDEFNCITEFISGTMEKARKLDEMSMVQGPLHGIPFCVKEDTAIAGYDCTLGCTRRLNNPEKETAILVKVLEGLGAIAFCRTNLPQTCISFGSSNPIFGKTLNPLNKHLGPGGSSSGTGCLVAAGGCPFGTGSDTGGSLRLPAHFCGLSTLKPTSSRLSRKGLTRCSDTLPAVPGILSKTAEDQALIFQALTDHNLQNKSDGCTVPISWNSQVFESKQTLRIGYITGFSTFPPIGDTQFLIDRVKSFLESAGHVLVPFDLPVPPEAFLALPIDSNIAQRFDDLLQNDEISPSISDFVNSIRRQSTWCARLKQYINSVVTSDPKVSNHRHLPSREGLVHKFLDKMDQDNIDLIICPVFPIPAIRVEDVPMFEGVVIYTLIWSWLDFAVGVVKFWTESGLYWKSSVDEVTNSEFSGAKAWRKGLLNDAQNCVGMPIGCQVVGRPYQEELVLKIMVELDDINK